MRARKVKENENITRESEMREFEIFCIQLMEENVVDDDDHEIEM